MLHVASPPSPPSKLVPGLVAVLMARSDNVMTGGDVQHAYSMAVVAMSGHENNTKTTPGWREGTSHKHMAYHSIQ